MRVVTRLISGLIALTVMLGGCAEHHDDPAPEQTSRPNIILVMTDDQGYGDLGMHDNPIVQTPVIDQLALESHRFTDFHVDPTCSPTRSALMSGKYSLRAGVWHTVMGRHMLSDRHHTLPEALGDAGYNTAMIGKWHLGDNYPFRPQDQGFDHVLLHGGGGVGQAPDFWGNTQFDDTYFLNGEAKKYEGFVTDIWFDEAIDYIHENSNKEDPFFLYLSTNAPHVPWRAPEKYIAPYRELGLEEDMAKFYGMIANIDENMGRLRAAMSEENIEDNTIFIFMTDNGSSMAAKADGEPANWLSEEARAAIGDQVETLNSYMRAGKASTYEGGHRVPFFISWPEGKLGEASDIPDLTAHVDVLPTLLDLAGIDISATDTDGVSLAPALKEGTELPDRTMVVTNQRVLHPDPDRPYSVMQGNWRYVHAEQGGAVELFDLSTDPGQTNNIIEQHPERTAAMAKAYDEWWQHTTGAGTPTTRPIIGTPAENPMRISGMDWLAPSTDQVPWWPGFGDDKWGKGWLGNEENFQISPWALKAAQSGTYRLTIYLHDEPAQKVIPRRYAHLQLNGVAQTNEIAEGSISSTFELELETGDLDIRAWFDDRSGDDGMESGLAAFYIYIEFLPDDLVAHNALSETDNRPNVIVVLADDMRVGYTGHEGHPVIQTPNIDKLASGGTVFSNGFATSAACTPSRTTLFSGLYERRHGVNFNSNSAMTIEAWAQTYPMLLKEAGYFVGYIGKNHTPVGKNEDGVIGYASGVMDSSFDYWYAGHRHLSFYPKDKKQHKIFANAKADTQIEIMEEGMENFFTPDKAFQEGYNFLDTRPKGMPFALLLNFNVPHSAGTGTMELRDSDPALYRTTYRDQIDQLALAPAYIAEADIVTPKIPADVYNGEYIKSYNYVKTPDDMKEREIRTIQTVSGIDKLLGKLLAKLDEQGIADNTIIVFSSDHGLMHGEHGLGGKVLLYEPSISIPFIIYDPRSAETSVVSTSDELVALVDIAPTVLELTGLPVPQEMQGKSLKPLMQGVETEWRQALFLENNMTIQNYPRMEGVRTHQWKYIRYFDKAKDQEYADMLLASIDGEQPIYEELYDLTNDMTESHNVIADPANSQILERLRTENAALVKQYRGTGSLNTYVKISEVGKGG